MKKVRNLLIIALLVFISCTTQKQEKPPLAPVDPVKETHFGREISDPYRYMENLKDSNVISWFKAQADYTRNILDNISGRKRFIDIMKDFDSRRSASIFNVSITENDKYFYLKTTPDDETGKLFYRDGFKGEEKLLFDPETYKDDSLSYTLNSISPSINGTKVAFAVAPNGSESAELLVMNVKTGELYPEVIDRCWFAGASWLPGEERFMYIRLNSSDVHDMKRELNSKAYLHTVGQSPNTDIEIFSRRKYPQLGIKEEEFPMVYYDKDNHLLFGLTLTVDNRLTTYMASADDLNKKSINWKPLFNKEDEVYDFETSKGEIFIYTPKKAPNFKIVKTSLSKPDLDNAKVVVAESKDAKIESFKITKDGLYYTVSRNGVQQELFTISNGENTSQKIELPSVAGRLTINSKSINSSDIWVTINGWTSDYQRYRFDIQNKEFVLENLSSKAEYPEYDNLVVEELMISSHDGVKVPLSLIYDKNISKDGSNPVFIVGYGAYGHSVKPFFNPNYLIPTTKGVIFAVAHVRGGGELGETWYKAGFKTTKPNTWKDLIACAEYLVNEKYTSSQKIAINGGSAGGILIGRALTERPDLFAAAIPEVGCLNTMRQEFSPNGPVNIPEFGTVKDSVECMALLEMDSYHHVKDGEMYPSTLVTAGMNDPRVIAWQPAKFVAKLQAANASKNPILFLVDYEAGHGIGNTKTKFFETLSDIYSFALWRTGHPEFKLN